MSLNQIQVLAKINEVRRRHGAPAVVWDNELARVAQDWSDRKQFVHSTDRQYGENLAKTWSFEADMGSAIGLWAKEMDLYDYNRPGFSNATGHGTALIWKKTKKIGAAVTRLENGAFLYVLKLSPPGNVNDANEFRQNVSRE